MSDPTFVIILKLLAVLALVAANGFFVAAEFALVAVRPGRIEQLVVQGNVLAKVVQRAKADPNRFISAAQLGITMASLGLGWIGEETVASLLVPVFENLPYALGAPAAHTIGVAVAFAIITFLHIVLGEQVPKMIALASSEQTVLISAQPTQLVSWLFRPFIALLYWATDFFLRLLRVPYAGRHQPVHSAEELEFEIHRSQEAGVLQEEEERMLRNVIDFAEHTARELMVPRPEIVGVEEDATVGDFLTVYAEAPRGRFPVYRESIDNVVGILAIKDVLMAMARDGITPESAIRDLLRPPYFVPETKRVGQLFTEMQSRNIQMAIVIDEFGGTAGLVTMEQIVEEIVGELGDELSRTAPSVESIDEKTYQVDAGLRIDEVNDELDLKLPTGDYETVAGFVLDALGHIPREGEQFRYGDLKIAVSQMSGVKVGKVLITRG